MPPYGYEMGYPGHELFYKNKEMEMYSDFYDKRMPYG